MMITDTIIKAKQTEFCYEYPVSYYSLCSVHCQLSNTLGIRNLRNSHGSLTGKRVKHARVAYNYANARLQLLELKHVSGYDVFEKSAELSAGKQKETVDQ